MNKERLVWNARCDECGFEVENCESKYAAKQRLKKLHSVVVPGCNGVIDRRYTVERVQQDESAE